MITLVTFKMSPQILNYFVTRNEDWWQGPASLGNGTKWKDRCGNWVLFPAGLIYTHTDYIHRSYLQNTFIDHIHRIYLQIIYKGFTHRWIEDQMNLNFPIDVNFGLEKERSSIDLSLSSCEKNSQGECIFNNLLLISFDPSGCTIIPSISLKAHQKCLKILKSLRKGPLYKKDPAK